MRIRRLTFILTEAVLLLFWVLTEQTLFAALAAALLLMALISLVLFLISANSFSAEINAPELAGKNEDFPVTIRLPGGLLANDAVGVARDFCSVCCHCCGCRQDEGCA